MLENGFSQFSPILEIVDRTIHNQSYPGNSGSYNPYINPILEVYIYVYMYMWDRPRTRLSLA